VSDEKNVQVKSLCATTNEDTLSKKNASVAVLTRSVECRRKN